LVRLSCVLWPSPASGWLQSSALLLSPSLISWIAAAAAASALTSGSRWELPLL
jgi:hypothetical protein